MTNYIKRQWLRFKEACKAFKREWQFNFVNREDLHPHDRPFQITGLGALKEPKLYPDDFTLLPPYYGQPFHRISGHVFTLKHMHINEASGTIRYFDTAEPRDGYKLVTDELLHDLRVKEWISDAQSS